MPEYSEIRSLVEAQGSKIISVEFIKKDGTLRKMLVQNAATRTHVKGEAASEQAKRAAATRALNHPNLLNIFDMDRGAIRSINMDTLIRIKCGRILWERSSG